MSEGWWWHEVCAVSCLAEATRGPTIEALLSFLLGGRPIAPLKGKTVLSGHSDFVESELAFFVLFVDFLTLRAPIRCQGKSAAPVVYFNPFGSYLIPVTG